MRQAVVTALILLLFCRASTAADPVRRFEITLVFTERAAALMSEYDNARGVPLDLGSIKVAPRGRPLAALVFFRNCKLDEQGMCNLELDTFAYTPTGALYAYRSDRQFWHRKPEPSSWELQMGRRALGLVIDPGDPAGTWRVVATARDRIANTETSAEWRFEVKPE